MRVIEDIRLAAVLEKRSLFISTWNCILNLASTLSAVRKSCDVSFELCHSVLCGMFHTSCRKRHSMGGK